MIKLQLNNEHVVRLVSLLHKNIHEVRYEIMEREQLGKPFTGKIKEVLDESLESDEMLLSYLRSKIDRK